MTHKQETKQTEEPEEKLEDNTAAAEETAAEKDGETNSEKAVDADQAAEAPEGSSGAKTGKMGGHGLWCWLMCHKKVTIPVALVVFVGLLAAVPSTRYAVAGIFVKQSFPVLVVDAETSKPVSSAVVNLGGVTATTDNRGQATVRLRVGPASLQVNKKYYTTTTRSVTVPLARPKQALQVSVKATGRPVPITVVNKISRQSAANVSIKASGTEAKTDKNGKVVIVLPPTQKTVKATLSGSGFNAGDITIQVTADEVAGNTFQITPAGKLYFLSNASGQLDVVKSDLDGGNRQTVLPGTGKEDRFSTILLASRDWKYIALQSKRDGGDHAKLFLIDTSTDKLTTMDEGDADFGVVGWSGDRFVYTVNRSKVDIWQPKRQALKSYSASAQKITLLDETTAEGDQTSYADQFLGSAYLIGDQVLYTMGLDANSYGQSKLDGKSAALNSIKADASQKKVVKSYPHPSGYSYFNLDLRLADFGDLYIHYQGTDGKDSYDEYSNGKVTAATLTSDQFFQGTYNTYVVSPSGSKTLWSDFRDGKNTMFVGDENGANGKQIGASEDYNVYGWFTDDYVLITKKGSEMHILPAAGINGNLDASLKTSDYYKPNYANRGYGFGGYGG